MSTIIKAAGPIRTSDGMSFNFDDVTVKAGDYLEQVRGEAAKIIAQAEQQAAAIRKRSEEEGKQAAMKAAERILDEKVGKQMVTLMPALKQAVAGIEEAKQAWLMHWEQAAVHVAAAIAGRVMRRQLERTPEITLTLVKEALELAAGSTEMQIQLNPDDYATLGQQVERLAAELSRAAEVQVVSDAKITRGGCRIQTRFGVIDQQFETQLARIEEELS
jgi:flagellar assembly protein FliH